MVAISVQTKTAAENWKPKSSQANSASRKTRKVPGLKVWSSLQLPGTFLSLMEPHKTTHGCWYPFIKTIYWISSNPVCGPVFTTLKTKLHEIIPYQAKVVCFVGQKAYLLMPCKLLLQSASSEWTLHSAVLAHEFGACRLRWRQASNARGPVVLGTPKPKYLWYSKDHLKCRSWVGVGENQKIWNIISTNTSWTERILNHWDSSRIHPSGFKKVSGLITNKNTMNRSLWDFQTPNFKATKLKAQQNLGLTSFRDTDPYRSILYVCCIFWGIGIRVPFLEGYPIPYVLVSKKRK